MNKRIMLIILLAAAVFIRMVFVYQMPLNGDSAIVGLMTKHISEFKDFPLYMWKNHYAGTLFCYVGAFLFRLFGSSIQLHHITGMMFSLVWLLLVGLYLYGKFSKAAFMAGLTIVALPSALVVYYSMFYGLFSETLIFTTAAIIMLDLALEKGLNDRASFMILGLISGVGFWLTPGFCPVIVTILSIFLLADRRIFVSRRIWIFIVGLFTGHLPSIIYNIYSSGGTLTRLGARLLRVDREMVNGEPADVVMVVTRHLWQRLVEMPAYILKMPVLLSSLAGPVSAALLVSLFFYLAWRYCKERQLDLAAICTIYVGWYWLFYAFAVAENALRFALPFYVALPFMAGVAVDGRNNGKNKYADKLLIVAIGIFLFTNLSGIKDFFAQSGRTDVKELIDWMEDHNYFYGFSDYDSAYSVTFVSREDILVSPGIYGDDFSDRMPQYTDIIKKSNRFVYILSQVCTVEIDQLANKLQQNGVLYKKVFVGGYHVFYDLEPLISPENLSLVRDRCH